MSGQIHTGILWLTWSNGHPLVRHQVYINKLENEWLFCLSFFFCLAFFLCSKSRLRLRKGEQARFFGKSRNSSASLQRLVMLMLRISQNPRVHVLTNVRKLTTTSCLRSENNPHSKIHALPFKLSEAKAHELINLTAYVNEHTFASFFKILGSVSIQSSIASFHL